MTAIKREKNYYTSLFAKMSTTKINKQTCDINIMSVIVYSSICCFAILFVNMEKTIQKVARWSTSTQKSYLENKNKQANKRFRSENKTKK